MENCADLDGENLKQRGLENFIILLLGANKREMSLLHLQKEVFLLWNFHPNIKQFLNFIKHYHGPFSREVQETIKNPVYLEDYWIYIKPKSGDQLSGGYVRLTEKGIKEYKRLIDKIGDDVDLRHLLSGIKIVRQLYDSLTLEELLLFIYDTYPEYTEKSNVYSDIKGKKQKLIQNLIKKGVIDEDREKSLLEDDNL